MRFLPDLFLIGYSLMLIGIGFAGVFVADWELARVFGLGPAALAGPHAADFLNQYRFLKAVEAAFGLFCLVHRRDILAGGPSSVTFLAGCALGVFARAWSWRVDGTPRPVFLVFLGLEAATLLLVWRQARSGRDQLK
jgi:hypothetical protein